MQPQQLRSVKRQVAWQELGTGDAQACLQYVMSLQAQPIPASTTSLTIIHASCHGARTCTTCADAAASAAVAAAQTPSLLLLHPRSDQMSVLKSL